MNIRILILSTASLFFLALSGCKEDNPSPTPTPIPEPTFPSGKVSLLWEHNWGAGTFSLEDNRVTSSNDTLYFERGKYYITNIRFVKTNDSVYSEPESYRLINLADDNSQIFSLNKVPIGTYKTIRFMVGVDSARNMSGAQTGALDPSNGMFWSWNTGYIHFKLEGKFGLSKQPFAYHIGGFRRGQASMREVSIDANFTVQLDSTRSMFIRTDLKKVFDGPNPLIVRQEPEVTQPGAVTLGIADNIQQIFSFGGQR